MFCILVVQGVSDTDLLTMTACVYLGRIPSMGEYVALQVDSNDVIRHGLVNGVTHHMQVVKPEKAVVVATVLLTAAYANVDFLLKNTTIWTRI